MQTLRRVIANRSTPRLMRYAAVAAEAQAVVSLARISDDNFPSASLPEHAIPTAVLDLNMMDKHLERLAQEPLSSRIAEVDRWISWVKNPDTIITDPMQHTLDLSQAGPPLFVRGTAKDVSLAIRWRNIRATGLQKGRLLAQDMNMTELFLDTFLSGTDTDNVFSDAHQWSTAVYHGIILALAAKDVALAVELACHTRLPTLNGSVSKAIAKNVSLPHVAGRVPIEMTQLAGRFAEKDELLVASQTVATALAFRLRTEEMRQAGSRSVPPSSELVTFCAEFRVDPGVIFPTCARTLQLWGVRVSSSPRTLMERAAVVTQALSKRQVQLKPLVADALSVICMSDVERVWLEDIYASRPFADDLVMKQKMEVQQSVSQETLLQDPKRWLIDARLLKQYADLLRDGLISCYSSSFPPFLEECGECHRGEQPEEVQFDLEWSVTDGAAPSKPADWQRVLTSLAPTCSYWTTLVQHLMSSHVRVSPIPSDDGEEITAGPSVLLFRINVTLPRSHECTDSISTGKIHASPPNVLYEDDHIIAFDKDASLPVSRHALCETQVGGKTTFTDIASVLMHTEPFRSFACDKALFRGGQLHRLDKETTGVLMYAKTPTAMQCLRHQMGTSAEFGGFPKVYHALCVVLERDLSKLPLSGVLHDPKDPRIVTRYHIVKYYPSCRMALVECRIQQGKKHQIRRHLASRMMPIVQDVEYGGAACTTPLMDRVALHASSVTFVHPITQRVMNVTAPLPEDMSLALKTLEKTL